MRNVRVLAVVAVVLPLLLSAGGCAKRAEPKYSVTFDVQERPPAPTPSRPTAPPLSRLDIPSDGPFPAGAPVAVRVTGREGLQVDARAHRGAASSRLVEDPAAPGTYRGEVETSGLRPGRYRPVAETARPEALFTVESPREIVLVASLEQERLRRLNEQLQPVYFESSGWTLAPASLAAVASNAEVLLSETGFEATVEGHGDARGTDEHNLWLGMWRAKVVKDALVASGLDPDRLQLLSHGKSRPAAAGSEEAAFALNRRVEIIVRARR
jgi:peptidoglycan-associated lipoprotein